MAGIVVPTLVVLLGVAVFTIARYAYNFPAPIERLMIFPMTVVPNLWGVWNILFQATHSRTHLSIGAHGALLPLVLGPLGLLLMWGLRFEIPGFFSALPVLGVVALALYYLVWKYVVSFLNGVLGIA